MSMRALMIAVGGFFVLAGSAVAQQPHRPEVSIQQLRNAAAQDVVTAVSQFADRKSLSVTLVAEPVTNRVIVAGDAAHIKQVIEIIAAIDTLPAQVQAGLRVVEVPKSFAKEIGLAEGTEFTWTLTERETRMMNVALRNTREIKTLSQPQIIMADNQPGLIDIGGQTFGYTLRLTPRVTPQGLLARIETGVKSPGGLNTIQTTLKSTDGGTTVFRLPNLPGKEDEKTEVLVVMTLHVVKN